MFNEKTYLKENISTIEKFILNRLHQTFPTVSEKAVLLRNEQKFSTISVMFCWKQSKQSCKEIVAKRRRFYIIKCEKRKWRLSQK